jgi:hypothetical protein
MRSTSALLLLGCIATVGLLPGCGGDEVPLSSVPTSTAPATSGVGIAVSNPPEHPAPWRAPAAAATASSYALAPPQYLSDPAAAQAHSIAVGDVSGDGRDDLVFLWRRVMPNPAYDHMEVYVAYQRSDGSLQAAVKIADSGNNFAFQLMVADLDRDGRGEVITAVKDGVLILHPAADGTFTSSAAVVGDPWEMLVTDVDRDGNLDVLVDASDTLATVVHGDGRGGISRTSTLSMPASATRTLGDVTGDGLDDVILATIFDRPLQEFRIYPALASGGYAAPIVLSRPIDANQTASLAVGDFNSDGRKDLVLDEARDGADLQVYLQDTQGRLGQGTALVRQRGSGTLLASDLDRDGATDLAIAHSGWSYVGYYLQSVGRLAPETVVDANQNFGRLNYFAAGDLNGDACTDLVVARGSQPIAILYGHGCVPRSGRAPDCRLPATPWLESPVQAAVAPSPSASAQRPRSAAHGETRSIGYANRRVY